MLDKEITKKIDEVIDLFRTTPELFYNNVWECYGICKKEISDTDHMKYLEYIDYITDKLGI